MNRRDLIRWLLTTAALPLSRVTLRAADADLTPDHVKILRDVAGVVLPGELGPSGIDAEVERFVRWWRGYRSGAQMGHGYGVPRARVTPVISPTTYGAQLEALAQEAVRHEAASFATLDAATQRSVIGKALEAVHVQDLPAAPDGRHVVSDLMAYYFRSSRANDLCYRARIGRDTCRGLAGSINPPQPLGREV